KALEFGRSLDGVEAEVYVTAPGAEIDADDPTVAALEEAHEEVFGPPPERDVTRWFSDASVLTRYGIATVNYGTSSGLPDAEPGEGIVLSLHGRFWRPRGGRTEPPAAAVVDFRVGSGGLTTETRVHVADARSRRRFARYWHVVRPFSGLTRIAVLRAAKRRAERA